MRVLKSTKSPKITTGPGRCLHSPGGITSYPAEDPYHYRAEDLAYCAAGLLWHFEVIGDWDHPRNQSMVMFTRTE